MFVGDEDAFEGVVITFDAFYDGFVEFSGVDEDRFTARGGVLCAEEVTVI
jgi:hypothetical protein